MRNEIDRYLWHFHHFSTLFLYRPICICHMYNYRLLGFSEILDIYHHRMVNSKFTKGQIISNGLFGVLEFSQKKNEWICRSSKNEFVRSFFWREFEDAKSPFEIIWPLPNALKSSLIKSFLLDLIFPIESHYTICTFRLIFYQLYIISFWKFYEVRSKRRDFFYGELWSTRL